jgi:imidazolonepropionase-like amidohydrolase
VPVDADLVLRNVSVIDGTGSSPATATIYIWQGVITAIDTTGEREPPEGTPEIDGTGKFAMPGLIDVHTHLSSGGLEARDSLTVSHVLHQFLHYGVTSILNAGGIGGSEQEIVALRRLHPASDPAAPRIFGTGGSLAASGTTMMTGQAGKGREPGITQVRSESEIAYAVLSRADAGMNGVTLIVRSGPAVFGTQPRLSNSLILTAVSEAANSGIHVFAHVTSATEMRDAVNAGVDAIVYSAADGSKPDSAVLSAMAARPVFLVPTLSLSSSIVRYADDPSLFDDPFLKDGIAPETMCSLNDEGFLRRDAASHAAWLRKRIPLIFENVARAHAAGVPIAAGSGCGNLFSFPGYGIHLELELLVQAGLTPMEAIQAGTIRGAGMIGKDHLLGSIEIAKAADIVILHANPLEDIRNTRTIGYVIKAGKVVVGNAGEPDSKD